MSSVENTNEKTIKSLYYIIFVMILIFGLGCIITAIVLWNSYTLEGLGYAFFFGGIFLSIVSELINYVIFGVIFDIKALRNNFESSDTITDREEESKKMDIYEELEYNKKQMEKGLMTKEEFETIKNHLLGLLDEE